MLGYPERRGLQTAAGPYYEIDGTAFYGLGAGVPVTPWDWSFDLDEEQASRSAATSISAGVRSRTWARRA
jgi:hypothetical protein